MHNFLSFILYSTLALVVLCLHPKCNPFGFPIVSRQCKQTTRRCQAFLPRGESKAPPQARDPRQQSALMVSKGSQKAFQRLAGCGQPPPRAIKTILYKRQHEFTLSFEF